MNAPASPRPAALAAGGPAALGGDVLVRNTTWALIGRVAFLFAWAVITPFLLERLGTERFAIWALLFALSGYFATFDLGLSQALLKFVTEFSVAGDHAALRGLVAMGVRIYALLGVAAIVVLTILRGPVVDLLGTPAWLRDEAGWSLVGMSVVLAVANVAGVLVAVLNGHQRMDITGRAMAWGTLFQIVGVVIVLHFGWGLRGLVVNAGVTQVAMGIGYWRAVRRVVPGLWRHAPALPQLALARVFRYGIALQIVMVGGLVQFQLDKLLLAHFAALAAVAQFELGARLSSAAWVLPMLILPPLVPAFSHLASAGEHDRLVRLYWRATRYLGAASVPLAAFLVVSAPALVVGWLGPGHRPVAVATAVMGTFLLLTVMTGVCTAALRGLERPWVEARYQLIAIALHLGLSLWLVPRLGLSGALWALLGSGAASIAYLVWAFHRELREPLWRWASSLAWPLLFSAIAAVICWRWPGTGWDAPPAGRLAAWSRVAAAAAVFATVVASGYVATGFVPLRELRELLAGAARGGLGGNDPK